VIAGVQLALLYLAPAVLLAVVLLSGRYPGEALIERMARAPRRRRRPPRGVAFPRPAPARGATTELAWSLAGRGPPR
jgi:hypothetical protein